MKTKTDRIIELASSFIDEKLGRRADVLYYHPCGTYGILKTDLLTGAVIGKLEYIHFSYAKAFDEARAFVEKGGQN